MKSTFPSSTQISLFQAKPTYQGELRDGWPHGRGITVWPDGRVYDGHWRKGIFQGDFKPILTGVDLICTKFRYICPFLSHLHVHVLFLITGNGTCVWSNGDTYEGEWEEGFAHGLGVYTYSCGDIFEGTLQQDKFDGYGVFTTAQNVKYRGAWVLGKLVGWALVISKSGDKSKKFFEKGLLVETPVSHPSPFQHLSRATQ